MHVIRGWKSLLGKRVVALGFFDGLHRGHQEVLKTAYRFKVHGEDNVEVITFYPHPQNFLAGRGRYVLQYLTTYGEKCRLIQQFFPGMLVRFLRFDAAMRFTSPQEFLHGIYSRLSPEKVFVGENFRFGYQAAGDVPLIRRYFGAKGVEVVCIPSLEDNGVCISSSGIRTLLTRGELNEVNRLLGYNFTIIGTVRKGRKLGSKLGFPTANLYPPAVKILPPHGVYVSYVFWKGLKDWMPALTHVGYRPTLKDYHRRVVETFIPSFQSPGLYGKRMVVQLVAFIRGERAFSSIQKLKNQMDLDLEAFYRYLQGRSSVINYPLNAIVEV
ncbi:MAG: riboflavin kinase [Atribacterota bacterium]